MLPCPHCEYDLSHTDDNRCPECGSSFDRRRLVETLLGSWPASRARWVILVAAISLLPFSWLSISAGTGPHWWSPLPLVFVIPLFMFESHAAALFLGCLVLLGSFLLFAWPLAKGNPRIHRRTLVALALVQILNWLWLVESFSYGLKYQGTRHTAAMVIINAALLITLVLLCLLCARRPKFLLAVTFHWIAWFWLIVYLFPYLGELP